MTEVREYGSASFPCVQSTLSNTEKNIGESNRSDFTHHVQTQPFSLSCLPPSNKQAKILVSDHHLQDVGRCQHRAHLPGKKNSGYFKQQTDIQDGTPSFQKERWGGSNAGGFVCPIRAVLGQLRSALSARHRVGSELLV